MSTASTANAPTALMVQAIINTPPTQAQFDQAYWLAQPPVVQALQQMPVDVEAPLPTGRTFTAAQLAIEGYEIDVPIMVWGWDPLLMMKDRQTFGFTWVPAALGANITVAPGVGQPGAVPYNPNNPPPGSIKVSTNIADYPPYAPPAAPPVPAIPATSLVGLNELGGFFQALGNVLPNGTVLQDGNEYLDPDGRGTFVYHQSVSPFSQRITMWFQGPVVAQVA